MASAALRAARERRLRAERDSARGCSVLSFAVSSMLAAGPSASVFASGASSAVPSSATSSPAPSAARDSTSTILSAWVSPFEPNAPTTSSMPVGIMRKALAMLLAALYSTWARRSFAIWAIWFASSGRPNEKPRWMIPSAYPLRKNSLQGESESDSAVR